jgi:SulP family sulfate permease
MEFPYGEADRIAKLVPNTLNITLEQAVKQSPPLTDLIEREPRVQELVYDEQLGFQERDPSATRPTTEIVILNVEGDVFFGAADLLDEHITHVARQEKLQALILRIKRAGCVDATFILALKNLAQEMNKRGKLLLISGVSSDVRELFRRSELDRFIGRENIFLSDATIFSSTRQALARAMEYVKAK